MCKHFQDNTIQKNEICLIITMNPVTDVAHRPETPKPDPPVIPSEPDVPGDDGITDYLQ
jgi:hypothetical protein